MDKRKEMARENDRIAFLLLYGQTRRKRMLFIGIGDDFRREHRRRIFFATEYINPINIVLLTIPLTALSEFSFVPDRR